MTRINHARARAKVSGLILVVLLAANAALPAFANEVHRFEVASNDNIAAVHAFASQSGVQILAAADVLSGKHLNAVSGEHSTDEALKLLLDGTGLKHEYIGERAVALLAPAQERSVPAGRQTTSAIGGQKKSFWDRFRLAQADVGRAGSGGAVEQPDAATGRNSAPSIEEIIVTAQKREERLIDIPMSIAVIGNQDIERRGLIGMEDYLRSIPGVNQVDRGSVDNAIVIRGITTSPENEVFSAGTTVATYFDETPITGAAGGIGVDLRPVDIERLEVLRGPQGTAYGSSSLGGTLRIIPKKPQLDAFGAKVAASYSHTGELGGDNAMLQGVLNIPIADTLALRAVGYRYDDSGFFRNVAGSDPATIAIAASDGMSDYVSGYFQDDVGRLVSVGSRVAALWAPTENLNLILTYLTQTIEQDGAPEATVGRFEQARIATSPQARVRGEAGELSDTEMDLASAVLSYDMGWGTLTTVGSWVDGSAVFARDFTYIFGVLNTSTQPTHTKTFSAESRFASQLEGPLQFLAGVFYEDQDYHFLQTVDWPGTAATSPFGTAPGLLSDRRRKLEQRAVFGEVSYDFTEKLTATVGGRFFEYDKSERALREGGTLNPPIPIDTGVASYVTTDEEHSIFKANLGYKPTEDSLLYLSWAEGFRLGRPDIGLVQCDGDGNGIVDGTDISVESTQNIASDFLENYELGSKFSLFDRRVALDASVYHIKWDGLPIRLGRPVSTCNLSYTANVGGATSDGVELQASIVVTDGLRVDVGGSYTKAELSEDAPPSVSPPAFEGDRLPGAAEINFNLAAQYEFDVAGYDAFVRADSFYTGEFYGNLQQTLPTRAGDYIKVDARAGVTIKNLSVELFVRNLTNEDAFTWRGLSNNRGEFFGYRLRPRTIGLQLGYSFE